MTKALQMFILQDRLNSVVNPNWKTAGNAWHRAVFVEGGETYEHLGFKWWKAPPELKITQIHIELVDIWHFIMSKIIELSNKDGNEHLAVMASDMLASSGYEAMDPTIMSMNREDTMEALDLMTYIMGAVKYDKRLSDVVAVKDMTMGFIDLCIAAGLNFDQLFRLYVAKNALNTFRQQNGYKGGSYIKNWALFPNAAAIEDNGALEAILDLPEAQTTDNLFDFAMERMNIVYTMVLQYHGIPTAQAA